MPIENKFERCEPDDPNRCQASSGKEGQCPYKAMKKPDGTYYKHCPRHNASRAKEYENQRMRNYRLGKFQARMEELADNDSVKSLREEVGITRMLLEEIVNQCQSGTDLIMYSNKIADLVSRIEKLVSSCHRLEERTGMLLDKTALTKLADAIISIVTSHVEGEQAKLIALQIMEQIAGAENDDA
jgi:hypothetical protein